METSPSDSTTTTEASGATGSASAESAAQKSFAETALELGGKSADEARRTGAIDTADDQVEALFAPQYQTVNSPAHRAILFLSVIQEDHNLLIL